MFLHLLDAMIDSRKEGFLGLSGAFRGCVIILVLKKSPKVRTLVQNSQKTIEDPRASDGKNSMEKRTPRLFYA